MEQTTKKHHYVWRSYLAAWTQNKTPKGQVFCLRKNRVFPVSLMNVAHENCFYGVKEMTPKERNIVYKMVIENTTGIKRQINQRWLDLYCAPFDFVDEFPLYFGPSLIAEKLSILKEEPVFKKWNIEYIENLHARIEMSGQPYISSLLNRNVDFWKKEEDRERFGFFLSNQFFRTKKSRDAIISSFNACKSKFDWLEDIHPENIWIPLSLIYASNVGSVISHEYSATIVCSDHTCFIVGDQPVVNTLSTFDTNNPPSDVEFFYPITPNSALLLTHDFKNSNKGSIDITSDEVKRYNELEFKSAQEMVFARESEHLQPYVALQEEKS